MFAMLVGIDGEHFNSNDETRCDFTKTYAQPRNKHETITELAPLEQGTPTSVGQVSSCGEHTINNTSG